MDANVIKDVLDGFENDEFIDSRSKLKDELHKTKIEFLKTKLGLTNDIEPVKVDKQSPVVQRRRSITGRK
jgi:hypothetical protein